MGGGKVLIFLNDLRYNLNLQGIFLYVLERNKQEELRSAEFRYLNNCAWLLATDRRAEKMDSFETIIGKANGTIKEDTRTSEEIIKDTLNLFKKKE